MAKIRVEIEVPRDDCGKCRLLDEFGCCLLFEKELNHREALDYLGFNDDIVEWRIYDSNTKLLEIGVVEETEVKRKDIIWYKKEER